MNKLKLPIVFLLSSLYVGCYAQKHSSGKLDYRLPKQAYKSRLKASDANIWKPVQLKVAVPTNGISLSQKGLFKTALERNITYLLRSFSLDHMLEPFRVRAAQPFTADTIPQIDFWDTKLRGSNA